MYEYNPLEIIQQVHIMKHFKHKSSCNFFLQSIGYNVTRPVVVQTENCIENVNITSVYSYSNFLTMFMCLMLSFLVVRKFMCLHKCWGRPGIVYPLNTLEMRHTTVLYCLAFAALSKLIQAVITEGGKNIFNIQGSNISIKIVIKLLAMLVYGGTMYPLFACISVGSALSYLVGSIFIWIYTIIISCGLFSMKNAVTNGTCSASFYTVKFARNLPFLVCLIALCVLMPYYCVCQFRSGNFLKGNFNPEKRFLDYTKKRFKKKVLKVGLKDKILRTVGQIKSGRRGWFVYPPALPCALTVSFIVVYMIVYLSLYYGIEFLDSFTVFFGNCISGMNDTRSLWKVWDEHLHNPPNFTSLFDVQRWSSLFYFHFFNSHLVALIVCGIVAEIAAVFTFLIQIPFILLAYKRHMKCLYRGIYLELIPVNLCGSATSIVVASTKFTGFQVAYLCWAYIIQVICFGLVLLIISWGLIMPAAYGYGDFLFTILKNYWPLPIWLVAIVATQLLVTKFIFLMDDGKYIAIDNRRLFFVYSYFIFFYNVFLGIFSFLRRVITAVVLGIIFLGRLDIAPLSRKFERSDRGFKSYMAFLHVQNLHSNPHMCTFIDLMKSSSKNYLTSAGSAAALPENEYTLEDNANKIGSNNSFARKRWFLFYTLVRNPELKYLRKNYLRSKRIGEAI